MNAGTMKGVHCFCLLITCVIIAHVILNSLIPREHLTLKPGNNYKFPNPAKESKSQQTIWNINENLQNIHSSLTEYEFTNKSSGTIIRPTIMNYSTEPLIPKGKSEEHQGRVKIRLENTELTLQKLDELVQNMSETVKKMKFTPGENFPQSFQLKFLADYRSPCWRSNNGLQCLPYFFIGGFDKCGTTDLHQKLTQHPQILTGSKKELYWWTMTRYKSVHHRDISFYSNLFSKSARTIRDTIDDSGSHPQILVDATPSTVWHNFYLFPRDSYEDPPYLSIHSMHSVLPHAKFVLIIRNPITRLYSDFLFNRHLLVSAERFHVEVVEGIKAFYQCVQHSQRTFLNCMYARLPDSVLWTFHRMRIGMYYVHLQALLSVYPPSNVFVLRLEDYKHDRVHWLGKLFTFLDVTPLSRKELQDRKSGFRLNSGYFANSNTRKYTKVGPVLNETLKLLQEFYQPFDLLLANLLRNKTMYN